MRSHSHPDSRLPVLPPVLLLLALVALLAIPVCAIPVHAQSSAPTTDTPNSPVAVPANEQPTKDSHILIQTETPFAKSDPDADHSPLHDPLSAPARTGNTRLMLTDGSFQLVRTYQIVGDRVRYFSVDREDWEELPTSLVDWKATHAWAQQHAGPAASEEVAPSNSDAMSEAAQLDREEAARRTEMNHEMPEVVPGLRLPDRDGVFALDHFHHQPELVEITPNASTLNSSKISRLRSMLPLAGQRDQIEIAGAAASVRLHDTQPQFYLSLDDASSSEQAPDNAVTAPTHNATAVENNPRGATSADSRFAIVRVDQRRDLRIVGSVRVSATGQVAQSENVQPVTATVLPGHQWLRLTPTLPLAVGEYALVKILSPTEMSGDLWDFSIHPDAPENTGVLVPMSRHP